MIVIFIICILSLLMDMIIPNIFSMFLPLFFITNIILISGYYKDNKKIIYIILLFSLIYDLMFSLAFINTTLAVVIYLISKKLINKKNSLIINYLLSLFILILYFIFLIIFIFYLNININIIYLKFINSFYVISIYYLIIYFILTLKSKKNNKYHIN